MSSACEINRLPEGPGGAARQEMRVAGQGLPSGRPSRAAQFRVDEAILAAWEARPCL